MRVLILGASGRVGQVTVREAVAKGHEVYAMVRDAAKLEALQKELDGTGSLTVVIGDLKDDQEKLTDIFREVNPGAIIFAAGSRGKDLLQVDLYGAIKAADVAEELGIKRFIMLSSVMSLDPAGWDTPALAPIRNYIVAKHVADRWLQRSTLDWTIAQPGPLHEDADTDLPHGLTIGEGKGGAVRISTVAQGLAALLDAPGSIHQAVEFVAGDNSVEDALAELS
ncbi:MAG: SDR family oxidoreductase [Corynebacterium sp.]|nr:SDR family oxidoreductase [Corynebacterium sp.]